MGDEASLATRLDQLESETQTLRDELDWLRAHPVRLPAVEATPVSMAAPKADEDYYSLEEVQKMMTSTAKKYAWTKGDFKVVPYGILWGNMAYETARTRDGDYTFYVFSFDDDGGDTFHVNARATRLGIDVAGPKLWLFDCAESGGKVEIDFFGSFVLENKPGVLLRHAYWEVKNDDYRLLMDKPGTSSPRCIPARSCIRSIGGRAISAIVGPNSAANATCDSPTRRCLPCKGR